MFTLSRDEFNSLKINIGSQFVTLEIDRGEYQIVPDKVDNKAKY
jgi:hypothetical protein